jgi:hypothetical protein
MVSKARHLRLGSLIAGVGRLDAHLPAIAGGLSLALARTLKIMDLKIKYPATEQWERAFQIFHLLL